MYSYLLIDVLFLAIIAVLYAVKRPKVSYKKIFLVVLVLVILTAIFDNVLIVSQIVKYHSESMLGLYVGVAPIEDFAYSLAAAFIVALLWEGKTNDASN